MRINVTQGIKDYEGNFIKTTKLENGQPVMDSDNRPVQINETLRSYLIQALNSQVQGETMAAEDKNQIYQLSVKMYTSKEVSFTHHEIAFMEERVGKVYGPLIYGRICDIFNGETGYDDNTKGENIHKDASAAKS
jgi:hypothetical protein